MARPGAAQTPPIQPAGSERAEALAKGVGAPWPDSVRVCSAAITAAAAAAASSPCANTATSSSSATPSPISATTLRALAA